MSGTNLLPELILMFLTTTLKIASFGSHSYGRGSSFFNWMHVRRFRSQTFYEIKPVKILIVPNQLQMLHVDVLLENFVIKTHKNMKTSGLEVSFWF